MADELEGAAPASDAPLPAPELDEVWRGAEPTRPHWLRRTRYRVSIALVAALVLAIVIHYPLHVTAECTIVPGQRAYLRSPMRGVIAEILVDEGAHVHKGDVIARLDDRDLKADRRKAVAEVERIDAELQRLRHGARPEEIAQQRAVVTARSYAASFAEKELARRTAMLQDGVGSKHAQDEAELDLRVKQNAAGEAAAALRLLEAGTRSEEITAQEAALARAKADLDLVDEKLNDLSVIHSPIDGVVVTPRLREHVREGIEPGGLVCEIADTTTASVEIYVPEREAETIAIGMPVAVKVEAYPLHALEGTVDFIAPAVEARLGANVIRVVAKLDNHVAMLRQDMTGFGEIDCGDRSLLDLATRRLVRWINVRFLL